MILLRYVEANPVRAGLVDSAKEWTWSAHREVIGIVPRLLVDEVSMELPDKWDSYVDKQFTEKEMGKLRRSVNRQSAYGDLEWQTLMSRKLGLESTLRPRGRPQKK